MAVLTLLAGIYYNVITRSYRLITMIPEWIMRWMGAEGVNRGDSGGEQVHGGAMGDTKGGMNSGVSRGRANLAASNKQRMEANQQQTPQPNPGGAAGAGAKNEGAGVGE